MTLFSPGSKKIASKRARDRKRRWDGGALNFQEKKPMWKITLTAATFSKIQIDVNTFGGGAAIVSHLTIQVK